MRLILEMCREIGIDCVPSVLPHGIAGNYGNGSDSETATEIWNKYFRFYCNGEARKAYIDNAVAPLCELLSEFTDIIPICNLTIENTNFADDPQLGYLMGSTVGTVWENLSALINDMDTCVKNYMPNMLTSTENMGDSFLQFRCNDLGVDFIGQNCYSYGNVKDPKEEYLVKPTYIGEFNTGSSAGGTGTDSVRLNFYPNALANGYKGAFYFSYSTGGDIFVPFKGLQTDPATLYPYAVEMSYYVRNNILTHRGTDNEINRPELLYNRETGDIYWFGGKNAESFVVESSADGGMSFKAVATVAAGDCVLENGLCHITDSDFKKGMSLCYRVTAVTNTGERYISAVNNIAEYDLIVNLLGDGDFENNDNTWTHEWGGAGSVSTENAYSGIKCLLVDKLNGKGNAS